MKEIFAVFLSKLFVQGIQKQRKKGRSGDSGLFVGYCG